MNSNQFAQSGFYRFSNYVYWLMILNILFVVTNILFFFAFITLIPSVNNAIFYFIASIPAGPAVAALCHSLSKLVQNNEIAPFSDFFQAYKNNFMDVLKIWLPILIASFILIIDIQYFNQNPTLFNQILNGIFLVGLLVLSIFTFYALIITTHFKFRIRDIYRLALYYIFKRLKISTGNICIIFLTLVLMFFTSDFIIFLLFSLVGWLLMINTKSVIEDVRKTFVRE
ncbi:Uncharacterized membrane protein YesL [Gracilibacillus ureilyticus]|uniref:Uncharacterized membrane protein YesL n=1 Tax=Gracilibacillus ureilyticus TaxID=531814 RepID=A0A1H9PRX6_9BACI|nr:DUF624 domain-containing protein [Gracilibacillus ureilyticus]SER50981.1 Uncharacterized membrane protein YesL [Gracilibacillus ureilyticus]